MQPGYGPPPTAGYGPPPPGFGAPQPGYGPPQAQWMPQAQPIPNCPPGLEYLATVDCFLIHQQISLLEAFTGFEASNKYEVKNALGQRIYLAVEKTDFCTRQCCGNERPFEVSLYDAYQREVLKIKRYLRCDSCWFPCCLQKLEIFTPNNELLGSVKQTWSVMKPYYDIRDQNDSTVLKIVGPFCTCTCCCGDVEFEILDRTGEQGIGILSKQYSGHIKEGLTDADNFRDFMFFEKEQGRNDDGIGMLG